MLVSNAATSVPWHLPWQSSREGSASGSENSSPSGVRIDEDAAKRLEYLRKRDQEVRAHEAAHLAAAGGMAKGGVKFKFETGADGQSYAVGGEVNIDISSVSGNPGATLRKAEAIRRAALAPADPSPQDQQVAAAASQMASRARRELAEIYSRIQTQGGVAGIADARTPKSLGLHLTA